MAKKAIKFQYCLINQINGDTQTKCLFPFVKFVNEFIKLNKSEYTLDIYDFKAKVEKMTKVDDRYIHICFTKLNDKNLPKKAYADERESLDIEINSDEYIGTDVHIIYDTHNNVIMLQRSRESLSIPNISYYLDSFAHKIGILKENQCIEIRAIYDTKSPTSECSISKIEFRFANIEKIKIPKNPNIVQMFQMMNKFDGLTGTICISVGRQRKHSLCNSEVLDTLSELKKLKEKYDECIPSAKISYTENDDTFVYDLFDDIMNDIGYVDILPRTSLKYEDIELTMIQIYQKRVSHLNEIINTMKE